MPILPPLLVRRPNIAILCAANIRTDADVSGRGHCREGVPRPNGAIVSSVVGQPRAPISRRQRYLRIQDRAILNLVASPLLIVISQGGSSDAMVYADFLPSISAL